ncbi:MAG: iron ABC transporter permease [Bacteroidales bacterium]
MTTQQRYILWILLIIGLVAAFLADLLIGSSLIPLKEVLRILTGQEPDTAVWKAIVLQFRLPKALTAVAVGMGLAVSGLQMQTVFRNPLAGPYVLGISAGASLGVAILVMGVSSFLSYQTLMSLGNWLIVGAAWVGSALILLLILAISIRVRDIMTLLILGIMFGSGATAVVSILQYFSSETLLKAFIVWTMGSLGGVSMDQLAIMLPVVGGGLLMSLLSVKMLNVFMVGENYARSMGMNIRATRILLFTSTSLLAGTVTAFCGPIGFIGIVIPHIARMLFRTANHMVLLPGSMLLGAILLLLSDIISQLPGSDSTLPINSITALIGIPIIIWLIIKNRRLNLMNS